MRIAAAISLGFELIVAERRELCFILIPDVDKMAAPINLPDLSLDGDCLGQGAAKQNGWLPPTIAIISWRPARRLPQG